MSTRINDPVKRVLHAQLARYSEGSEYKSVSPCCSSLLLVNRVHAGALSRFDRCVLCGQRYWYMDDRINGEGFMEPVEPPNSLIMEHI